MIKKIILFLILICCVLSTQVQTQQTQLPCCNRCPPPTIKVNTITVNKEVIIHIPYPVLKAYPQEPGDNGTCPNGYNKIDDEKCLRKTS